jgi:hypothetical protein
MHCHPFHYHPHREEIIYVIYGRAEQWVGNEYRILSAGEMAHIPAGTVHAPTTPTPSRWSSSRCSPPPNSPTTSPPSPDPHDVSTQAPWASLRQNLPSCRTRA